MTTQIFTISCCGYTLFSFDREDYAMLSPRDRASVRNSGIATQKTTTMTTSPRAGRAGGELYEIDGRPRVRSSAERGHISFQQHRNIVAEEDWSESSGGGEEGGEGEVKAPAAPPKWPTRGSSLPSKRSSPLSKRSSLPCERCSPTSERLSLPLREVSMVSVYHDASEEPKVSHETAGRTNVREGEQERAVEGVVLCEAVAVRIVDWQDWKESRAEEMKVLEEAMAVALPEGGDL